jgi:ZIP family zinc transporter
LGTWIGGLVFSPFWGALALAVGTGAILQVVYEVGRLVTRTESGGVGLWRSEVLAGAAVGVLVMYATALVVPA